MAGLWQDFSSICSQIYQHLPAFPQAKEVEKIIVKEVDMINTRRSFVRMAGLSGALAVIMAAYGSHGFNRPDVDPQLKQTFDVGNKMHLIHSVALLASPLTNKPVLVGTLLTTGMVLFSGSCYYHALTGNQQIRFITPYGGMLLIFAWLSIVI